MKFCEVVYGFSSFVIFVDFFVKICNVANSLFVSKAFFSFFSARRRVVDRRPVAEWPTDIPTLWTTTGDFHLEKKLGSQQ